MDVKAIAKRTEMKKKVDECRRECGYVPKVNTVEIECNGCNHKGEIKKIVDYHNRSKLEKFFDRILYGPWFT